MGEPGEDMFAPAPAATAIEKHQQEELQLESPAISAFEQLVSRKATDAEKANLYRMQQVFNFPPHDPIWLMLVALEYYQSLYVEHPQRIEEAANYAAKMIASRLDSAEALLKQQAETELAKIQGNLVQSVTDSAKALASNTAKKAQFKWGAIAAISMGLFGLICGAGGWLVAHSHYRAELAMINQQNDVNLKSISPWLASAEGKAARRFSSLNNVADLLDCSTGKKRTEAGKTYCYPVKNGRVYGYVITIKK